MADQAERLAHHALRGELWEKAVAYLGQAGLRAMARGANREAVAHLEQALEALPRLPESRETTELTIEIHTDLRNALSPLGELARMGHHLHEAEVLARTLGDQHRLARIANFMVIQCLITGDYDGAVRFGQEALTIAGTFGDRAIEVVATSFLGTTHAARGEFGDAITLLERNVAIEGDLRYERFGTLVIQSALSGARLADMLSQLGRFDAALGHAEAAVRIAETADHPYTLYFALLDLGLAHLRRGDLPRATRILERGHDLCRTWQIVVGTPLFAATLGAAYAPAGRADEALPLVEGAVQEFRARPNHFWPGLILLCAGMACLGAGRIDEAASHAREALALTRRLGTRGSEAHTLCLAGDVASTGCAEDAEGYYREALALAGELGMRPANLGLLQSVSQSLAGRTALLNLLPLSLEEVRRFPGGPGDLETLLWHGSYPAIFDRHLDPTDWLSSYVGAYVERDVRQILNVGDQLAFQTFLRLCAGRSAQLLNLSALGADAGVTHATARAWISVLEASFVAYRLPPFHSNLAKRLVKTPKLHLYDSGLLCFLLGIRNPDQLREHPLRGAIFETWVSSEVLKARLHRGLPASMSFYRDRKGSEVDIVVEAGRSLVAVETKSARTVVPDFFAGLDVMAALVASERRPRQLRRVVVYGGDERQQRTGVTVLPWSMVDRYDWTGVE